MIYIIVADTEYFEALMEEVIKRDCHDLWQPLSLIPNEIFSYKKNGKSEKNKSERFAAYSTLFFALFTLYEKKNLKLCRTESGKPYLEENDKASKIKISISHTDGAVAVALSDEYEIGVDIQSVIDENRVERLEKRFFQSINIKEENIHQKILYLNPYRESDIIFEEIEEVEKKISPFTRKWAYCESLMKCDGGGFASIEKISSIQKEITASTKVIEINKTPFVIATAIKKTL